MKIFENKFLSVQNDDEQSYLKADWKTSTANMNSEEHKQSLSKLVELAKATKPTSIIFNLSNFYYSMDENEQEDLAQVSIEAVHEGLAKCALIPSKGMMEQIAVEQSVKKVEDSVDVRFFRDEITAKQWLGE